MAHLFVARLWFEGNRFSRGTTDAAAFGRREDRHGDGALDGLAATATELAAVLDFRRDHPDWQVTVSRCASAEPGGPIGAAWFDAFVARTVADLEAARPTHVYLSLHGAAITTSSDTPELDWLRALRRVAPSVPIAASFDLHGNIAPALIELIDFGTAYRRHPHTDMRETAARALDWLARADARLARRPVGTVAKLGRLVPSFNMLTAAGPMAELEALARAAEQAPGIIDVSVFGGFPYADTAHADGGILVWSAPDAADAGRAAAASLIEAMRERLPRFEPTLPDAAAGLRQAADWLARGPGLVAVTDPADNPLSGGQGTTTTLLRALLAARGVVDPTTAIDGQAGSPVRARIDDSVSAPVSAPISAIAALGPGEIVFAAIVDAAVVALASQAGVGATVTITVGDPASPAFGAPLTRQVRVQALTPGRFVNTGPMDTGRQVDCGASAVLDCAGLRVIVTSAVAPADDPAFFVLHGIEPAAIRLLCVKAKNHFRAAFASRCVAIIDVDCPGPAAARLALLPLRHRHDGS